ncbi:unnamed protein product, partial [Rotaria sp. Silwood1]
MAALNWIIGILYSIELFFFEDGYVFETESRLCMPTTKTFSTSIYAIFVGFVVPLSLSIVIYSIIWYRALQSSRRIAIAALEAPNVDIPNARREMKLARNMVITVGLFAGGGTPFLTLVLWHRINPKNPPPESFYLLIHNDITFFVTLITITLFMMNKQ